MQIEVRVDTSSARKGLIMGLDAHLIRFFLFVVLCVVSAGVNSQQSASAAAEPVMVSTPYYDVIM